MSPLRRRTNLSHVQKVIVTDSAPTKDKRWHWILIEDHVYIYASEKEKKGLKLLASRYKLAKGRLKFRIDICRSATFCL